jgi:hypothetical protein
MAEVIAEPPSPAQADDHKRDQRDADHVGELRRRVEDSRGPGPLASRKPVARRLRDHGERGRLRYAQEHPRGEDPGESAGDGGDSRREGPEQRAPAPDPRRAHAVDEEAHGDLQDRIGPVEGAEEDAQLDGAEAELPLQLRGGDGEIYPVEEADEDSGAQEKADPPSPHGYAGCGWGRHGRGSPSAGCPDCKVCLWPGGVPIFPEPHLPP